MEQSIYDKAKVNSIIERSMSRIIVGDEDMYISIPHILDTSYEYWSRMLYPDEFGFEPREGDFIYDLTEGETIDGVDEALDIIHGQ